MVISIDAEVGVINEENKKLVTEDYLGLTDGEDVDVVDHSLVPFLDTFIKIKEAEKNIYFIPDGSPGICTIVSNRIYIRY